MNNNEDKLCLSVSVATCDRVNLLGGGDAEHREALVQTVPKQLDAFTGKGYASVMQLSASSWQHLFLETCQRPSSTNFASSVDRCRFSIHVILRKLA